MKSNLLFISNQIARTRHEIVDGVKFLVAPCVAFKAGVWNGELVPSEEIDHHVPAWNGRPFVIGHPKDIDGEDASANDPERLAALQIGQLFNVEFIGDALKGEVWIDLDRAKRVDGGAEVVARLESGKPLEVSTAYFRDRDEQPGVLAGEEYDAIARNLRPDHLAALLDAEGACSWADGCGAPRVNQDEEPGGPDKCVCPECGYEADKERGTPCRTMTCPKCGAELIAGGEMETNVLGKARRPTYTGTTNAPWESPTLAGWLKAYPGDVSDGGKVADLPQAAKDWIAGHTLLGDPKADNERDLAFFPVVTPAGKLSGGAVRAVLGGRGVAAKIPDAAKESAQAMARSLLDKEFKTEAANESRVLGALRTIASAFGIEFNQEASEMEELIKAILEDGRLGLNEKQLQALGEDVLAVLVKALKAMPKVEEEAEPEVNDDEQEAEDEAEPEANEQALPPEVTALAEAIEKRGGAEQILALLDNLQANQDGRKAELVTALVANTACAFSKERLAQMNVDDLETLAQSLSPADYSGRGGGPVSNTGEVTPLVMPDIFAQEAA